MGSVTGGGVAGCRTVSGALIITRITSSKGASIGSISVALRGANESPVCEPASVAVEKRSGKRQFVGSLDCVMPKAKFIYIAIQMSRTHAMINSIKTAFEQCPERFYAVGRSHSAYVFAYGMLDN